MIKENSETVEEYLTPQEAAERKGVTLQTIYKAIERGLLPSSRVLGRVSMRVADVDAYEPGNYRGERPGPALETILWQAADKLRGSMDAAEYKHVVLGLIFLRHTSEAFERRYQRLLSEAADPDSDLYIEDEGARVEVAEDRDEYAAEGIFWVPQEARWSHIASQARNPDIGLVIDAAMSALEKENTSLKGVLPKDYARPALDKRRLGEMVDLIGNIGQGDAEGRRRDLLGQAYEYFLGRFAAAEGKRGGEFYTPSTVVQLLVAMIEPYKGRVYDPCCGSGGMFVQSERFVEQHGGRLGDISIYGQELNATTWKLAKMNLAIRGIENNLGQTQADTFHQDLHPDMKADFILANPPFNISDWGGEHLKGNVRWKYGTPPNGNANFAWVQHMIHHLSPRGKAGFVLANGSLSSNSSGEGEIRQRIIEADLVDCIVALPPQLFYTTPIPVCLWFLSRNKARPGETLFIDARNMGEMVSRVARVLTQANIDKMASTYHAWLKGEGYSDLPGFCRSASKNEISSNGYLLTPGRYVGSEEADDEENDEMFNERVQHLASELNALFSESDRLEKVIQENLLRMGYGK